MQIYYPWVLILIHWLAKRDWESPNWRKWKTKDCRLAYKALEWRTHTHGDWWTRYDMQKYSRIETETHDTRRDNMNGGLFTPFHELVWTINQSNDQSIGWIINQPINQSISQSINQSIDGWVCEWVLTWIAHAFDAAFTHAGNLVDSDGQVVQRLGWVFPVKIAAGHRLSSIRKNHLSNEEWEEEIDMY